MTRFTNNDKERIDLALFLAFMTLETATQTANERDAAKMLREMAGIVETRDRVRAMPTSDGRPQPRIGFTN